MESNPDRGWTSKETIYVPEVGNEKLGDSYDTVLAYIKHCLSVDTYDQNVTLSRLTFSMQKYKTLEVIPDETIEYMRKFFKAYRELGIKVYLNFNYQHGHEDSIVTSDIVLKHIDQYAPLWNEFSDVIYCYCISLIGSWGEWTSLGNGVDGIPPMTAKEKKAVADKVLANLPDGMYMTMRQPELKTEFITDADVYKAIGYDQSAFFGYDYIDEDIGQGNYRPGQAAYNQAIEEAPYGIMHAETFTTRWFREDSNITKIEALGAIKGLSEQRITSFNVNHGYADISTYGGKITDTILYGWRLKKLTQGDLSDLGVLVTDSWFKDARGKAVERSAFDYIRDYLGYRISAESLSVTGGNNAGEKISVSMDLKNYGFSAAFNLESGFAIIDDNNNVVSETLVGNPTEWHSTSPTNYNDRTQMTHNVTANMTLPTEAGNYKIAFFLRNDLGQTARLDNLIEYADGYNILHMFSVS